MYCITEPFTEKVTITLIICVTLLLLTLICALFYISWQNTLYQRKKEENNKEQENTSNHSEISDEEKQQIKEEKERKIKQEEEDRAKALVKDFYEATRTKTTSSDHKNEDKCDIDIAKQLIDQYKSILDYNRQKTK